MRVTRIIISCDPWEVWDPFSRLCREIYCASDDVVFRFVAENVRKSISMYKVKQTYTYVLYGVWEKNFSIHSGELLCWFPWALTYILLSHPPFSSFLGYDKMYILLLNLKQKFIIVSEAQKNLSNFPMKKKSFKKQIKVSMIFKHYEKRPFFLLLKVTNTSHYLDLQK